MNNWKVTLVRCPRCFTVLPEPSDAVAYRCGNCSTRLRAKPTEQVSSKPGTEEPLHEDNNANSDPPVSPLEADAHAPPARNPDASLSEAVNSDSDHSHASTNCESPDVTSPPIPNPNDSRSEAADNFNDHCDDFRHIQSPATITSVGYYDDGISSNDDAIRALRFPKRGHDPFLMRNGNDRRTRREKWHRSNEKDAMEMLNEMKKLNLDREKKLKRSEKMSVVRTVGGAAPFVACYFCFVLLILPSAFLLFGKRRRRFKCAACGEVCCFSLIDGSLIPTPSKSKQIIPLHRLMGYHSVSQVFGRRGASSSRPTEPLPKIK